MPKVVHYVFMGNAFVFWLLCITGVGIPFAILYLVNGTIRIEDEMPDPERFVQEFRAGNLRRKA